MTTAEKKQQKLEEKKDYKKKMAECLRDAMDAWKDAFFIEGYGREFDKWKITPDPVAIAMIADTLFMSREV